MLRSSNLSVFDAAVNHWLDDHRDVTVVEVKVYPSARMVAVLYYQEEQSGDSA